MLQLWNLFEFAGTIAFAVSGAIVGMTRNMDVFGITVLAVLTAVGGGMIRDVLAGYTPPMALENPGNLLLSVLTALAMSWLFASYRVAGRKRQIVTFFYIAADTVGLASFTVTGTLTGLSQGRPHTFVYPIMLGLLTAVGGGVLRDLMAQRIPSVLSTDVYATASLAGSLVMCLCWHYESQDLAPWLGAFMVVALRFFAVRYRWQLIHPMERRKRGERIKNGR